jgi:uncharacterized protein with beta-barrel porin domain
MTNTNRRQLARVRNAFLGATALAGVAIAASPASAIVINDGFTPDQVVDTTNITGVGQMVVDEENGFIGLCTVSLINPRTVIFASHCVNENPAETAFMPATGYGVKNGGLPIGFFFQANNNTTGNSAIGHWLNGNPATGQLAHQTNTADFAYNSNFVVYNTNCCKIGLGNNFFQSDVAMAALDTPAVGIPTWTLLFSALSAPTHATIEGYGGNGIGSTGSDGSNIDFKRRVAENIVSLLGSLDDQDQVLFGAKDGLPANLYMSDFNDPKFDTDDANTFDFNIFHDAALPREGITAPGDSGGPLVIDQQFSKPTIAAVLSGGDRFFNAQPGASYGTTSFYQPLYLYWDWIIANNPYKYVGNKAGNGNWTDASHWQMNLDPAYMTIDASGNLINALPTTPALGQADVAPGFGEVCYFDDCVDITTGKVVTDPTKAKSGGTGPFGGMLGQAGFVSFVQSYVAANNGTSGGPAQMSIAAIDGVSSDPATLPGGTASDPGIAPGLDGSDPSADASKQSNWTNPEGNATVDGVSIQGAPGSTLGQAPNDTDGNAATAAPARYYDVTLAADGTTTLNQGDAITIDRLTINGANTSLVIANGGSLTSLIDTSVFAGNFVVNGAYKSVGAVNMFGGILSGTGAVTAPQVNFLLGAISPGTTGTIGTLTINGNLSLGAGSATLIDSTATTADLIKVNGTAAVGGTLVYAPTTVEQQGASHVFLTATSITGAYNSAIDTIAGVLKPSASTITTANGQAEVVTIVAGTFVQTIGSGATTDQKQVGAGLDAARTANFAGMIDLFHAIDPLSDGALAQSLEDLAPDAERAAPLLSEMETTGIDNMLWQQMGTMGGPNGEGRQAGLHVDSDGLQAALSSASGSTAMSQQLLSIGSSIATNPGGGNDAIPTTGTPAAPSQADDSMLMLPNGAGGFLSGSSLDGSVAIGGGGGRADVRGMIIGGGLDMPLESIPGMRVGASIGYSDASAVLRASPASLQTDALQGSLYARYDWGANYIAEAFGAYGHQTMETRRIAFVGGAAFGMVGHTSGDTPSAGAYLGKSIGVPVGTDATVNLIPAVSFQYQSTSIDGFTETGSPAAMSFHGYGADTELARVGLDANVTFDLMDIHVTPNVHAFWVNNFGDTGVLQSSFALAPGSIMSFAIASRDRSYAELGLGADLDLGEVFGTQATLSGRYDSTADRGDVNYGAWTGRLSIKF